MTSIGLYGAGHVIESALIRHHKGRMIRDLI